MVGGMKFACIIIILAAFLTFDAVADKPSDNDLNSLIQACHSSGSFEVRICDCVAKKADKEFSPTGFAFLIALLNKDKEKAAALREKLELSELMTASMYMTHSPGKCAEELGD